MALIAPAQIVDGAGVAVGDDGLAVAAPIAAVVKAAEVVGIAELLRLIAGGVGDAGHGAIGTALLGQVAVGIVGIGVAFSTGQGIGLITVIGVTLLVIPDDIASGAVAVGVLTCQGLGGGLGRP